MTGRLAIRSYEDGDRGQVGALYAHLFGPALRRHFERRWSWEFESAPAAHRFSNLLAERDGRVIAHLARLPTRLAVAGRVLPAAFLTDVMADANSGGVASLGLISQSLRDVPAAMLFGAQPRTHSLFVRLGMRDVAVAPALMRVENAGGAMAGALFRVLRRRAPGRERLLRRWMFLIPGVIAAPLVAMRFGGRAPRSSAKFVIERPTTFDERFDELWVAMQRHCPVGCVRDRAFLEWRYRAGPTGAYRILTAVNDRGVLAAACVLSRIVVGPSTYGKFMECLYRDDEALGAIVRASLEEFRGLGVDVIVSIGLSAQTRTVLQHTGFRARGLGRLFAVKADLGPDELDVLHDPTRWYISPGDGDVDFEETVTAEVPSRQAETA